MAATYDGGLIDSRRGLIPVVEHFIGWTSLPLDLCFDIALLPLDLALAPFGFKIDYENYSQKHIDRERAKEEAIKKAYTDLQAALAANPGIALQEKWYVRDGSTKWYIFTSSLKDSSVDYSPETLEAIYARSQVPEVFLSRSCRVEFLAQNFGPALERAEKWIHEEPLTSIVSNPKTPLAMVKLVAESDKLPFGAVLAARENLARRKSEVEKSGEKDDP
ncbi:MAG: hypothetical protein U1F77_13110 [Kiritimatiellia bacterium]